MPDLSWLEAPTWVVALAITIWLTVRSVAWAWEVKRSMSAPSTHALPFNGHSAEWRGETREVLKGLRAALRQQEHVDRETLAVLREVRDELRSHNSGAEQRHELVKEMHALIIRRGDLP